MSDSIACASSIDGVAAVHHKFGAGDERSFVAGKEKCTPSDLLGLGAAFERSRLDERLKLFLPDDVEHRGEDEPWVDRVDADFVGGVLDRGGIGEEANGALGAVIGGGAGRADETVDGRDVDDGAGAALSQRGDGILHPEPYALLVDVDDGIPFLFAGFLDALDIRDAGVVDENVETTEFALATLDCGAPVGGSGDLGMKRDDRFRADLGVDVVGGPAALVVEHVPDHDLSALADEKAGFSSALSSRAGGNQSNFAFEPIHGICLVGLYFQLDTVLVRKHFISRRRDRRFTGAVPRAAPWRP